MEKAEEIDLKVETGRAGNSEYRVREGEGCSDGSGAVAVEEGKLDSKGSDKVDDVPSLRALRLDPCCFGCGDDSGLRFWSFDVRRPRKLAVSAVADACVLRCRLDVKVDAESIESLA